MKQSVDIGQVFDRSFKIYQRNATPLLIGSLIFALVGILPFTVLLLALGFGIGFTDTSNVDLSGGAIALAVVGFTLAGVLQWVASLWLVELSVKVAASDYGREPQREFGELVRASFAHLGTLILMSIVAFFAIFFGFLLLIVPGLILLTIWSLVAPVIVLENKGPIECFGRSYEIVKGNGFEVFGAFFVIFLVLGIASAMLGLVPIVGNLAAAVLTPFPYLAATAIYMRLTGAEVGMVQTQPVPPSQSSYPQPIPGGPPSGPPVPPPPTN